MKYRISKKDFKETKVIFKIEFLGLLLGILIILFLGMLEGLSYKIRYPFLEDMVLGHGFFIFFIVFLFIGIELILSSWAKIIEGRLNKNVWNTISK